MRTTLDDDLSTATWHKSTYSAGGNDCLEVADGHPTVVPVRDSKTAPYGPTLRFTTSAWSAFIDAVRI
jgi:hypothetical protein